MLDSRHKKLIEDGIESTWRNFKEAMGNIRKQMDFSDEDIFEENTKTMELNRYWFHVVGAYAGSECWLYDNDGSAIRNRGHLKNVLSKWECLYEEKGQTNPYEKQKIYVVPADVHY